MKKKITAWVLYEKEFGAICWNMLDKTLMIYPTRKAAQETKRGLVDDRKGVRIVRVTLKGKFTKKP